MDLTPSYQTRQLDALYHLSVELSAQTDLDAVLHTALDQCLNLTGSEFGFVGLITSDRESMDVVATEGFFPGDLFYERYHLIPLRPNIFSIAVLDNKAIRSADAMADHRRVGQPEGHPPVHSFLGVPLRIQGAPIGMIGVANRPSDYEDGHEQLLMTYAAQIAIAIRNAQLVEQLEQIVESRTAELEIARQSLADKAAELKTLLDETVNVEERERQRIAQDMHDGVNQLLYGALFQLKSAEARLGRGDIAQAKTALEVTREILHQIESEIKRIIHDLRPPILDNSGLVPAVKRHIEQVSPFVPFRCSVNVLGNQVRLSPQIEINLFRLIQEALQNTTVHAQAQDFKVLINFTKRTLKVVISDNGVGFDWHTTQQHYKSHLGLIGMRERVDSLNGTLLIRSAQDEGTRIEVSIPIQPEPVA